MKCPKCAATVPEKLIREEVQRRISERAKAAASAPRKAYSTGRPRDPNRCPCGQYTMASAMKFGRTRHASGACKEGATQ